MSTDDDHGYARRGHDGPSINAAKILQGREQRLARLAKAPVKPTVWTGIKTDIAPHESVGELNLEFVEKF
jgi:hypothetical protein